ncbi:MAG: hypothetical protein K8R36_14415 [Planctomycetales bacterium]|nr:hypothetical protein [Planctomycetales bacterium]
MKFSIRDILWFTAVVALAVGWWLDHGRQAAEVQEFHNYVEFYERQLAASRSSGFPVPPGRRIPGSIIVHDN